MLRILELYDGIAAGTSVTGGDSTVRLIRKRLRGKQYHVLLVLYVIGPYTFSP